MALRNVVEKLRCSACQNRNHNKENDLVRNSRLSSFIIRTNPIFMKKLFKALFSLPQYSVSNLAVIYQKI